MYDMSINPFNQTDTTMDIEDAEELVLKALAPLGTEYVNKLKELPMSLDMQCIHIILTKIKMC